jgi:hypothetical protein
MNLVQRGDALRLELESVDHHLALFRIELESGDFFGVGDGRRSDLERVVSSNLRPENSR